MSQGTPTAMAKEPERERAHSSCSTIVVRRSAPLPPYFSSYSRPRNPSSPRRGQIDRGIRPAVSHSSTCGMTSRSMNCRTVVRNISCCSLKIFTGDLPAAKGLTDRGVLLAADVELHERSVQRGDSGRQRESNVDRTGLHLQAQPSNSRVSGAEHLDDQALLKPIARRGLGTRPVPPR